MPTFNTKVVKYNNDLQGTVIIDGKEYSFDNLVKDEQVEIEMSKDKSRVTVKRICSSSPNRVKPNCGIYDKCGGCRMAISGTKLKQLKEKGVIECENCGRIIFLQ